MILASDVCWLVDSWNEAFVSSSSIQVVPITTTIGTPMAISKRITICTPVRPISQSRPCSRISSNAACSIQPWSVWGGEFGRQPTAEYAEGTGPHHNAYDSPGMAGGGIKGGASVGATDELGAAAVERPMHVKHLHATVPSICLASTPIDLSYFYSGLDQNSSVSNPSNHR